MLKLICAFYSNKLISFDKFPIYYSIINIRPFTIFPWKNLPYVITIPFPLCLHKNESVGDKNKCVRRACVFVGLFSH